MPNLKSNDILYPIFPNINDQPQAPTSEQEGNGADLVQRYNNLINAIAPRIKIRFFENLGENLVDYYFLALPVPLSLYLQSPSTIEWDVLDTGRFSVGTIEPVEFGGLNFVFTLALTAGDPYGSTNPLDSSYLEINGIDGMASFVDLPTVTVQTGYSAMTWNNLVGVLPLEPNLKIEIEPSTVKPDLNTVITGPSFS